MKIYGARFGGKKIWKINTTATKKNEKTELNVQLVATN